jgi:hypothetical protein
MLSRNAVLTMLVPPVNNTKLWKCYNNQDEYLFKCVYLNQKWTRLAIMRALRKAGIRLPTLKSLGSNNIEIQNNLKDGTIYIQVFGSDWLILKESP